MGGLNYTLTNLLKKELSTVEMKLTLAEAKYDTLKEELDDIKTNLSSSEEQLHLIKQKLGKLSTNHGYNQRRLAHTGFNPLSDEKKNFPLTLGLIIQ